MAPIIFQYKILTLALALFFLASAAAQTPDPASLPVFQPGSDSLQRAPLAPPPPTADTLLLKAAVYEEGVLLKWYPLYPATWLKNNLSGYRLERVETDSNGVEMPGSKRVIAERLLPKDAAWFLQHKLEEEGLMEAVGALLWDTTFQFKDKSLIDPDVMRWNYVMNEVETRLAVGQACGLSLLDSTVTKGKFYRYSVAALGDPALNNSLDLLATPGAQAANPQGREVEFVFPEDKSLTDMMPKGKQPVFPQVFALAKAYGDSIVVRWAPNTPSLWQGSNKKGYQLSRSTGDSAIPDSIGLMMPMPRDEALALMQQFPQDSMLTLAVSILYNEIPITGTMKEQAEIFETRFGFALFAAENSGRAGDVLGLRYVDRNVKPGEKYNYLVKSLEEPGFFSRAEVEIVNEKKDDPAPVRFQQSDPGDRVVNLVWDMEANKRLFSSYELERSDDKGKTWKKLTQKPLVFIDNPDQPIPGFGFIDSVAQNYTEYRYRLRGLGSFGEWSSWAELKAQAVDLTPPPPANVTVATYNDTTNVATIRWEVADLPEDFKQFNVLLSEEEGGPFDTLAVLKKDAREFIWKPDSTLNGDRAHFIWILSSDQRGNKSMSLNRYLQVPDLKAPDAPAKLAGRIDEDGKVTLVWEHSKAKDLAGYRVYTANSPDDEFSILNQELVTANTFEWQVESKSLNKTAYYIVSAEDRAANRGPYSRVLALKRPDKVPPVPPFITSAAQDGVNIVVKWKPSVSSDAKKYNLLRRDLNAAVPLWLLRDTLDAKTVSYTDGAIVLDVWYEYKLTATDDSGNVSDSSNVGKARRKFLPGFAPVLKMQANQSAVGSGQSTVGSRQSADAVEISWEFVEPSPELVPPGSYKFLIYRSIGNEKPIWYADVPADQRSFRDTAVVKSVLYNYAVMVSYDAEHIGEVAPAKSVLVGGAGPAFKKEVKPDEKKQAPAKLELRGRGAFIPNGDASPDLADGTDFGRVGTGSVASHVFTLKNAGDKSLTLPAKPVALEGNDLSAWAIRQPDTHFGGGGSQEFSIEFRPNAEGERSVTVRVAGEQPWSFTVKGIGVAEPEMDVQGKGVSIASQDESPATEDDTDFGGILAGNSETHVFTIKNLGINPLKLEGEPALVGDPVFSLGRKTLGASIPAGGQATFEVVFSPKETGAFNATFQLASNDLDEQLYTFRIHGVGSGPEISVTAENEVPIKDGDLTADSDTDFGKVKVNGIYSRRFIIKNLGDRALNLSGKPRVLISGENAADFSISQLPPAEVKPGGGAVVFSVQFKPGSLGLRKALISIENEDSNESNYDFAIQGTGATPPDLNVYGKNNTPILPGDSTPDPADDTDFGTAETGGVIIRNFTIVNAGGADLHLSDAFVEGNDADDFRVTRQPGAIVPGDKGSTVFSIEFKPGGKGLRTARVRISSDDEAKKIFEFGVQGMQQ